MVASVARLAIRSTAEFSGPYYQRRIQQPARFEVGEKPSYRFVHDFGHHAVVLFDVMVGVPGTRRASLAMNQITTSARPGSYARNAKFQLC
jgi:hypothetical protein